MTGSQCHNHKPGNKCRGTLHFVHDKYRNITAHLTVPNHVHLFPQTVICESRPLPVIVNMCTDHLQPDLGLVPAQCPSIWAVSAWTFRYRSTSHGFTFLPTCDTALSAHLSFKNGCSCAFRNQSISLNEPGWQLRKWVPGEHPTPMLARQELPGTML